MVGTGRVHKVYCLCDNPPSVPHCCRPVLCARLAERRVGPGMTSPPRLRDLARANDILQVLVRHGFGEMLSRLPLGNIPVICRHDL